MDERFYKIIQGDVRESLSTIPAGSIQMCVTSPPYWGLRDYGVAGQIGQEPTPDAYVQTMVEVFRGVRRVLHDSGTVWLNLGDTYAANRGYQVPDGKWRDVGNGSGSTVPNGLKPKDLCMIPWRVALALQADGWWLSSVICWAKKSCMPESVTDRPTNSWEPIFLLAKSHKYFYDAEAVREPNADPDRTNYTPGRRAYAEGNMEQCPGDRTRRNEGFEKYANGAVANGRNQRNVWNIAPEPYAGAHFATFPTEIPRRAILADSRPGDTILDPFNGSGTSGQVAVELGRYYIGCELNPEYIALAHKRIGLAIPPMANLF